MTWTQIALYIHSNSFNGRLKIDTKCCHLLAITLYPTKQTGNFYMFSIGNNKSFISQNLKVEGPLGGKFDFFVSRDLKFKAILITKSQKSSSTLSEL